MSVMKLAEALRAKSVDDALRAFEEARDTSAQLDPRHIVSLCNLCSLNRKNEQAYIVYDLGCSRYGVQALVAAGLNMNALLYACCREPDKMLPQAMQVWSSMSDLGLKLDTVHSTPLKSVGLTARAYSRPRRIETTERTCCCQASGPIVSGCSC